jgi:hypothetical protein
MYIVFQNSNAGFKHIRDFDSLSLLEAIQKINAETTNQNYNYYIYKEYEKNVPLFGSQFNVYKRVKAVAGSKVAKPQTHDSHEYAITHNCSMAWLFSDNLFE